MERQERPTISVIMGVHNQRDERVLREAVISVLNQTRKDFEFIIWDDGSDENAAKAVKSLGKLDDRIIVAGKEENRGLAFSLNECIKLAKGKYIARMDADDISLPRRFEKQLRFLEEHPAYDWCGTNAELFDENGVWGFRPMPENPTANDHFPYSPFIHPSVMFRASVFDEKTGYLDTEETLRCEDYEIFMSLMRKGLKGCNLQETLFRYRETKESYSKRKACFRVNEAKIRFRNYKKSGMLFPFGWLYVLRPIVACLIPAAMLMGIKRTQGTWNKLQMERRIAREAAYIERKRGVQGAYQTLQGMPEGHSGVLGNA